MNYCHEHDPLLQCITTCHTCGRITYPTDGTWLTSRLLLVTFGAGCDHVTAGQTQVVDVTALTPQTHWCHAPTQHGEPCRNRAWRDGRCHHHRQSAP